MNRSAKTLLFSILVVSILSMTGSPSTASDIVSSDEADVFVRLDRRIITLEPDGRVTDEKLLEKKILTYEGMDSDGDPHIAFNDRCQTLEILASETATPEGRVLNTLDNGMNLITPFALAKSPAFTDGKQMVVTHVGLDLGAVTRLHYVKRDREVMRTFLSGEEYLASHQPVKEKTVQVKVPEGTELRFAVLGGEAEYTRAAENGYVSHTWKVENTPLRHTDEASQVERTFLPRLVYSTAGSWQEVTGKFFARLEGAKQSSEAIRAKVAKLVTDENSAYRKLSKLHGFVHDHVRAVTWSADRFPEAPRTAAEVYASRYGLALERTLLLSVMLDEAGMPSECVMMSAGPEIAKEVPSMTQFPVPLLEVELDGKKLLVDPTAALDRDTAWDYSGRRAVRYTAGRHMFFTVRPQVPITSTFALRGSIDFAEDLSGLGRLSLDLSGIYSPQSECLLNGENPPDLVKKIVSESVTGFEVDSVSIIELSQAHSVFETFVSFEATEGDSLFSLTLGSPEISLATQTDGLYRQTRDLPLLLGWTGMEKLDLELIFPEDAGRIIIPQDGEIISDDVSASRTVMRENGKVHIKRKLKVTGRLVAPGEYPEIRQAVGLVTDRHSNTVFLAVD